MTDSQSIELKAFFLPFRLGRLFCVQRTPIAEKPKAAVLFVPPFGEEMHKSRRMAALQAAQLAQAGCAVLQVDLFGTGDSDGDFAEASWANWQESVLAAAAWLQAKVDAPLYLWGLRLGATLAVEVSAQIPNVAGLLLWQPVVNGEAFLTQFLRIKVATEMLADGKAQTGTKALKQQLAAGGSVEIGGLALASALAVGIDALRLAKLPPAAPVHWLDVSLSGGELSPANSVVIAVWHNMGASVASTVIDGEAFWASQEITECPALLTATTALMQELSA